MLGLQKCWWGRFVIGGWLSVAFVGPASGQDWLHQNNAWVPGPNGTSVRSPDDSPQPTSLTWSMVPGGVEQSNDSSRVTKDFTEMGVTGLSSLDDYGSVLEAAVDAWASAADITNLGYIAETGDVSIGASGLLFADRGSESGVGHIRFMAFDQAGLGGATALAQATPIPEPGTPVDNGYNLSRAGDIRFRSDAYLWDDLLGQDYFLNIAMHEIGHILGFAHNSVSDSVLSSPYTELTLGTGDIAGAVAIYGTAGGGGTAIPEPASLLLAMVGLVWLTGWRRREQPAA
ncbi:MAG: matrixin family metalloprotease [Pirellulales bacterium]|nr:matrixin family metalloprotease [Pirellulales bacterium]